MPQPKPHSLFGHQGRPQRLARPAQNAASFGYTVADFGGADAAAEAAAAAAAAEEARKVAAAEDVRARNAFSMIMDAINTGAQVAKTVVDAARADKAVAQAAEVDAAAAEATARIAALRARNLAVLEQGAPSVPAAGPAAGPKVVSQKGPKTDPSEKERTSPQASIAATSNMGLLAIALVSLGTGALLLRKKK